MFYVVDSHAIVWFLDGSTSLGARARQALQDEGSDLVIPTIVLAEIKYLKAKGKIRPTLNEVMETIEDDPRIMIYPFDQGVLESMPTRLEIHDAIIVGTAVVYGDVQSDDVAVITRDAAIKSSGLVETVW